MTVYTARFLGLPAVVSDIVPALDADPQQAFVWQWVAQHVSQAIVDSAAERQLWRSAGAVSAAQIKIIPSAALEYVDALINIYQRLQLVSLD
jgi:hypothetical protein